MSGSSPYSPASDPVLMEIFTREASEHVGAIRELVARMRDEGGNGEFDETLPGILHTLRGSALMAGATAISNLAERLENHIERLIEERLPAQGGLLDLLEDSCRAIDASLHSLGEGKVPEEMADDEALLARIAALDELLDMPPEPVVPELTPQQQAEMELRQVFAEEGEEILARYLEHLQQWRGTPSDDSPAETLERELHTLKGSARVAGVAAIADIGHVLESLLIEVLAKRVAPSESLFDLLDEAYRTLSMMVEQVKAGDQPVDVPELIARVREFVTASQSAEQEAPLTEQREGRPDGGQVVRFPAQGKRVPAAPEQAGRPVASMLPEQFRVRAELMDRLASMASEAGVCRSRVGQQIEGVRHNIEELHRTIERLRDQLRRLDIETESQMLSRVTETEESAEGQFDPLELDRFSRKQTLARGIMESLNDLTSLEDLLSEQIKQSENLLAQQGRATQELQDVLNRARLQPFSAHLPRLHRLVEQLCEELDKRVDLYVEGAEQELDRGMLARILPSIEHILRNAVVHGIEPPGQRTLEGKPETGKVSIQLERHGADMLIRINDDGAGLNLERIREKAVEAGYLHPTTPFTEEQAVRFIQRAGFSTADGVTQLAGRGVGLDVVKNEIRQLGGTLQVRSWKGEGMQFTLRLPLIRYLSTALLVQVNGETYALPPMGIEGITRVDGGKIQAKVKDSELDSYVECLGQSYRIEILADLVGTGRPRRYREDRHYVVVLLRVAEHRLAVVVDKVIGEREILMKSFGPQLSRVRGIPGATFLDDGSAVMILDLAALIEGGGRPLRTVRRQPAPGDASRRRVLVVDDSITVRSVMSQFLERHGMQVLTAKDGREAMSVLESQRPDVILLDVEMPHMNGYELTRYIRHDPRLQDIPIIMITSRAGSKHRQKALALGVEFYLNKPYREEELLAHIQQLQEQGRSGHGE